MIRLIPPPTLPGENLRQYPAEHGIAEEEAVARGME